MPCTLLYYSPFFPTLPTRQYRFINIGFGRGRHNYYLLVGQDDTTYSNLMLLHNFHFMKFTCMSKIEARQNSHIYIYLYHWNNLCLLPLVGLAFSNYASYWISSTLLVLAGRRRNANKVKGTDEAKKTNEKGYSTKSMGMGITRGS